MDEDLKDKVVDQLASTIVLALEEVGYSPVALSYIYDIILGGLLDENEERLHDVMEAMQYLQEIDDAIERDEKQEQEEDHATYYHN